MQRLAFVIPILPGKTAADREAMESCERGDRREAFRASRERLGIARESAWIQNTPSGDVAVVHIEAADLGAAFEGMGRSEEPFDRWFREYVRDVHGISLEAGFSPPEQVLDFRADVPEVQAVRS